MNQSQISKNSPPALTIVVPCFNEAANIPILYDRLRSVLDGAAITWELVAVDDHSHDTSFEVLSAIAERDPRVSAIRLARNVGSHVAVMCGLDHSGGQAVVMMSADLQDSPEIIPRLVDRWRGGDQVVWAVRGEHKGRSGTASLFSRMFHSTMAVILGRDHLTSEGADFFLIDREVVNAVRQIREGNLSLFAMLVWLGFRQGTVTYAKEQRQRGKSGWTFRKKVKLFIDSVTAFSYLPIRFMSVIGVVVAVVGGIFAGFLVINYFVVGVPSEGWTSLMVVVLIIGGLQMTMLGVLGEYLWRTLDEARRRPRYNVEQVVGTAASKESCAPDKEPHRP